MAILPDLTQKSPDELRAIILAMAKQSEQRLSVKVSAKGAVAVYGLGRWPVTLYRSQMERLLDAAPNIREFIKLHAAELAVKPTD
jgi:hypothetical protein